MEAKALETTEMSINSNWLNTSWHVPQVDGEPYAPRGEPGTQARQGTSWKEVLFKEEVLPENPWSPF